MYERSIHDTHKNTFGIRNSERGCWNRCFQESLECLHRRFFIRQRMLFAFDQIILDPWIRLSSMIRVLLLVGLWFFYFHKNLSDYYIKILIYFLMERISSVSSKLKYFFFRNYCTISIKIIVMNNMQNDDFFKF